MSLNKKKLQFLKINFFLVKDKKFTLSSLEYLFFWANVQI